MHSAILDSVDLENVWTSTAGSICIGYIVQITEEGQALVDFPGNQMGPIKARTVINTPPRSSSGSKQAEPVLLLFENGDRTLPIIVGIIHDTLYPSAPLEEGTLATERLRDAFIDGRRIVFDAKEEIVLRCGKSSVTLRKDGKIVIKGVHLVSRASEINKIKGGSVAIN